MILIMRHTRNKRYESGLLDIFEGLAMFIASMVPGIQKMA